MKYLILITFLTFLSQANAQYKLEITMSDSKYAKMQIVKDTEQEAKDKLVNLVDKKKYLEGEWKSEQSDLSKTILNPDGNETTIYYHPTNFTYTITDISQEVADKEAKKQAKKQLKADVKLIKDAGKKWRKLSDNEKDKIMEYLLEIL